MPSLESQTALAAVPLEYLREQVAHLGADPQDLFGRRQVRLGEAFEHRDDATLDDHRESDDGGEPGRASRARPGEVVGLRAAAAPDRLRPREHLPRHAHAGDVAPVPRAVQQRRGAAHVSDVVDRRATQLAGFVVEQPGKRGCPAEVTAQLLQGEAECVLRRLRSVGRGRNRGKQRELALARVELARAALGDRLSLTPGASLAVQAAFEALDAGEVLGHVAQVSSSRQRGSPLR